MRLSETSFWANLSLKIRRSRCDWSVKEPFTGEWKAKVRTKIRSVDQVIVFCGEHTHTATGVSAELMKPRRKKTLLPAVGILRQNLRVRSDDQANICSEFRTRKETPLALNRPAFIPPAETAPEVSRAVLGCEENDTFLPSTTTAFRRKMLPPAATDHRVDK